jgi:hypothetical protein
VVLAHAHGKCWCCPESFAILILAERHLPGIVCGCGVSKRKIGMRWLRLILDDLLRPLRWIVSKPRWIVSTEGRASIGIGAFAVCVLACVFTAVGFPFFAAYRLLLRWNISDSIEAAMFSVLGCGFLASYICSLRERVRDLPKPDANQGNQPEL